jgi:hypothetical protein
MQALKHGSRQERVKKIMTTLPSPSGRGLFHATKDFSKVPAKRETEFFQSSQGHWEAYILLVTATVNLSIISHSLLRDEH